MPEMFQQILHYMNTALTSLFACEACLKIYAYGFRVRNRQQTAAAASCGNQSPLYRSHAGSHFYGTENKIWAELRPYGKVVRPDVECAELLL